jgi:phage terminase Nu1 subunit (DNA packaging protein)
MNDALNKIALAELLGVSVRTVPNWQGLGWQAESGRLYDVPATIKSVVKALQAQAMGRSAHRSSTTRARPSALFRQATIMVS